MSCENCTGNCRQGRNCPYCEDVSWGTMFVAMIAATVVGTGIVKIVLWVIE